MSLDGYIAGPKGEHDWIVIDPEIDFAGIMSQFSIPLDRSQDLRRDEGDGQRREIIEGDHEHRVFAHAQAQRLSEGAGLRPTRNAS